MAVTKRCIRCHKPVRPDGTCQYEKCVLYVPEENEKTPTEPVPATEKGTSTEN